MSRYWENSEQLSPEFLADADISIQTFNRVVKELTLQIKGQMLKNK
jgi:hypothetical protein